MKILVTGCSGQVGWELVRCLQPLGEVIAATRRQMDISDFGSMRAALINIKPDVIVNAAAYTAVDKAEDNEKEANLINGQAPGVLATESKRIGALLIHYSTDYVFDGEKSTPYIEGDVPNPINAYGRSKLMGEQAIQAVGAEYVILRASWVYAARGTNFLRTILRLAQERDELRVVSDQFGVPTWARLIAESTTHVIYQSLLQRLEGSFVSGSYNLAASGKASWFDFAEFAVAQARQSPNFPARVKNITPIASDQYPLPAKRPKNSRLMVVSLERKFKLQMPDWKQSMILCMGDLFFDGAKA